MLASFDVDAQKGFSPLCPNELPVAGAESIVDDLNHLASKVNLRLGSKDAHPANPVWLASSQCPQGTRLSFKNADMAWNRHCVVGTSGFELLDGLPHPQEYNFFVWKGQERDLHPYSAVFHDIQKTLSTGVREYLASRSVSAVIVAGLVFDFCVKETALDLAQCGFSVYVYKPATRSISPDTEKAAFDEMTKAGVSVLESESALLSLVESQK